MAMIRVVVRRLTPSVTFLITPVSIQGPRQLSLLIKLKIQLIIPKPNSYWNPCAIKALIEK